jgi:8-oxo-dGTP diphosphatase
VLSYGTAPAPAFRLNLAVLSAVRIELQVIVGAAIIVDGRVLACARSDRPAGGGKWEFPGGKVEDGETEVDALIRECEEELGVPVAVGDRIGGDVVLAHGRAILKVYLADLIGGAVPHPHEHEELRWLGADELDSVVWLPADAPIVEALRPLLDRAA